jgi:RNA polymerase sigma-70 factor (ECF subfamily)
MQGDKQLEDKCLILDFISGNDQAFPAIFDRYHHALYLHVIKFVKSPDIASDIVQDVFVKIWEIRASINPDYSFKAFMFTIAKNHLLNILKRSAKEKSIRDEIFKYAIDAHSQCEDVVIYNDLNEFAEKAIDCLPPQRKIVFRMFKEEGLDYHQIADNLGLSTNTVRDHLTKASKFIRGYLKIHTGTISILFFSLFF